MRRLLYACFSLGAGQRTAQFWLNGCLREIEWLPFFDARDTGLRDEEYPRISFGAGRDKIVRCFPDKLPIGIDKADSRRFVFLYLVTRRIPIASASS